MELLECVLNDRDWIKTAYLFNGAIDSYAELKLNNVCKRLLIIEGEKLGSDKSWTQQSNASSHLMTQCFPLTDYPVTEII